LRIPARWTIAAGAALFAIYMGVALRSPELDAPWRVDEGQRIAEAYFWRLLVAGDVSDPAWFRKIDDRSHPPVNKYFFGAAIDLAGVGAPRNLDLAAAYEAGAAADSMPSGFARAYLPMRRAARVAVLAANMLMAAAIAAILLRIAGLVPALLSQLILFRHFLFAEHLFHARSDIAETFLTFATIVPLMLWARARRRGSELSLAAAAGAIAALAFQTRLNGGVAVVMCMAFMLAYAPRRVAAAGAVLVTAFVFVAVIVNPFYWAATAILPSPALPLRIVDRFRIQVADLRTLLRAVGPEWHLHSLSARFAYAASILFSGKAGIALALCMVLALAMAVAQRLEAMERAVVAWAVVDLAVTALWIPLRWENYLLIALPPLVLAGGVAVGAAIQRWKWAAARPSSLAEQRAISPSRTSQSRSR
jgi:hypothetical protein